MLLWVAGWFPNSENPYNGVFIHRHALAVSHQIKDFTLLTFATYFIGEKKPVMFNGSSKYPCVFVPVPQFKGGAFKLLNFLIYYFATTGKLLQLILEHQPDNVHVHAADKIGVVAAFWKSFFNYKLWLTEHWAIFNDWVPDRFENRNKWFQSSYNYLWRKTDVCACINSNLHQSMEYYLKGKKKNVWFPNALDGVFEFAELNDEKLSQEHNINFLHVSNFEPRKNTDLIIEAFKSLRNEYPNAHMTLVGAPADRRERAILECITSEGQNIQIFEPMPAEELLEFYQKASALLLFSDSENAPCVISEALSFGLPVIASAVGGIPEMIDSENGILIHDWYPQENNSAKTLKITTAMLDFCKKCKNFDRLQIQEKAKLHYSSERIAKQLIYDYTCAE